MIVSYLFLCLFLSMVAYMVYFQVYKSEDLLNSPYNKRQQKYQEEIVRGSILASDGTVLARTDTDEEGNETRVYPYESLFAQVVGYSGYGSSGLEATQSTSLMTSHADIAERVQKDLTEEKNIGDNLVTTLNVNLQQAASDALGENQGAIVVLETSTGRILADVSKPDFNPNTISEDWDSLNSDDSGSPFLNRALQGQYAPGSTFKIVTALAYLRQYGSFDNYSFECTGEYTQGGYTIHCSGNTAHGTESLADAFANSCNCAFSDIATQYLGSDALMEAAEDFYFNKSFSLELSAAASSFSLDTGRADGLTMQTAIGQGDTLVSPLHMALITEAVANGGNMMQPHFVDQVESYTGTIVSQTDSKLLTQVMSAQEAAQITDLMKGVVQRGTGTALADLPYDIAGKTGTAEYGNTEDGTAHSWFVGFSNTGNSDITVAVIVEGGGEGGGAAAQAARAVFASYFGG